jgi:uncharacterized membrane protein YjjP (DUF1212 family)
MFSIGALESERTHLLRLEPGENDLGRLARTADVARLVLRGDITAAEGTRQLDAIAASPPRYHTAVAVLGFGLASASAARFLGGGLAEVAAATAVGMLLGILAALTGRWPGLRRAFLPVGAMLVSAATVLLAHLAGPLSVYLATLAGIIILVPGLMLTTAITELANDHLVAGTARLAGAFTSFVILAFGVALGAKAMTVLLGPTPAARITALPEWTVVIALVAAPLAFSVLLKAEPRDVPWIIAACAAGFAGSRLGSRALGPELGLFIGSVVVGLAGTAFYALTRRPTAIVRVPGILLLVPGSVGFASLTALLDRNVVPGVETLFRTILMAVALAAGLLVASVVRPARIVD